MTHSTLTAETDGERIWLDAPLALKDGIKALPGSRYDATRGWSLPLAWASCLALRGQFGDALRVGPELSRWSWTERRDRIDPCNVLRVSTTLDDTSYGLVDRLKPFQRPGVAWLVTAGSCLLGDDLGSGKTVQVCEALRVQGLRRGVVFAPKSTLTPWARHLREWAGLSAEVVTGSAAKRRKVLDRWAAGEVDVVVLTWELARHHSRLASYGSIALKAEETLPKELQAGQDLDFVVADEAQRMRDPKAKMTRAVWAVGERARHRYALSGTPVSEAPDDMWAIMRFVSPDEWPTKSKWVDRYAEKTWNRWGGLDLTGFNPRTRDELFGFFDPRFRAMPKDVVLRDLPPRSGGLMATDDAWTRYAEMSPKQRRAYEGMLESMVAELDSGHLVATTALSRMTRLLQLAAAYGDVVTTETEGGVRQSLVLGEPSCKLDVLEDLLTGELEREPVVVFTVSRQLALLAAARAERVTGRPSVLVVGGQTQLQRDEAIDDFQAGRAGTVVVTVAAGGAGVTLTRARAAVFLQRDFSYVNNYQAEGRIHRIGSEVHDRVMYYDVVTQDTVEPTVMEVLRSKQDLAEQVTRPEQLRALLRG